MNVYEIAEKFKISVGKVRKLEKAGLLRIDKEDPILDAARTYLRKGKQMPVAQLVALLENPAWIDELGALEGAAHVQLHALGNATAAPLEYVAEIDQAARGDDGAVKRLASWMKAEIAAAGRIVNHHYLAVRLVLGSSKSLREYNSARIARAFLNCRKHESFAGWSRVKDVPGGRVTEYGNFRKEQPIDL